MTRPLRRAEGTDGHLTTTFIRNADGFFGAAKACQDRFPEIAGYFLAIAIELSLKAYLLDRGISDDWNRIHIGHDLRKALKCARRAGFDGAPPELPRLAAVLSPYYIRHAIAEVPSEIVSSMCRWQACQSVRGLLGPIGASAVVVRLRHLRTVFGFRP